MATTGVAAVLYLVVMMDVGVLLTQAASSPSISALSVSDEGRYKLVQKEAVACIQVVQRDAHFSHPLSVASVVNNCGGGCSVSDVRLACPGWLQALVDPAMLTVQGNGQCLLASGQAIAPASDVEFAYNMSPPLPLSPLSATFHCPS
ncbi:hypothetical protein L7F22_039809 [Adiantum nelumboides]|nr:hypothetical protein [Adiantum nelumboides]